MLLLGKEDGLVWDIPKKKPTTPKYCLNTDSLFSFSFTDPAPFNLPWGKSIYATMQLMSLTSMDQAQDQAPVVQEPCLVGRLE